jgi:hypothetical protein
LLDENNYLQLTLRDNPTWWAQTIFVDQEELRSIPKSSIGNTWYNNQWQSIADYSVNTGDVEPINQNYLYWNTYEYDGWKGNKTLIDVTRNGVRVHIRGKRAHFNDWYTYSWSGNNLNNHLDYNTFGLPGLKIIIVAVQRFRFGDMVGIKNQIKNVKWMLLLAASVFSSTLFAQWQMQGVYVNSYIGTGGINLLAAKAVNRHQFGFGLRVNMYSLGHKDDQNKVYVKRLYPKKFYQNFGLAGYYQFNLFSKINPTKLFLFTDVQITHSTQRNRDITPHSTLPDGRVLYQEFTDWFGPFLWIENTIGVGVQVPIYKNWSLINKFGFGVMSIIGDKWYAPENTAILVGPRYEWEICYTVQLGLSYTFNK